MLGSSILDVAIGMALIYLFLSLVASAIQEGIAAVAESRAANLLQGLQSLFSGDVGPDGTPLLASLYDHGLVRGLYRDLRKDLGKAPLRFGDRCRMILQKIIGVAPETTITTISNPILLPSYIPARTFALAMIDILNPGNGGAQVTLERLRLTLGSATVAYPNNKALQAFSSLADSAGNDLKLFQRRLEDWYNDAMDRISGWYKKHTQNILLVIGLALAVAFNVNSIRVAETLWTNKDAREAMVAGAKEYLADHQRPQTGTDERIAAQDLRAKLKEPIDQLQKMEHENLLPLGWPAEPCPDWLHWMYRIAGWLVTALALSLGASFWFDTLNKFMVIRGTIKPEEKSAPEPPKG